MSMVADSTTCSGLASALLNIWILDRKQNADAAVWCGVMLDCWLSRLQRRCDIYCAQCRGLCTA